MLTYTPEAVGLVVAGHGHDPAALVAEGQAWLVANAGLTEYQAAGVLPVDTRPAEAWWGGDARGFVQPHHDGATAVTVVNLPPELPVDVDPAVAEAARKTLAAAAAKRALAGLDKATRDQVLAEVAAEAPVVAEPVEP